MQLRIATYNLHGGIGTDGIRDYRRIGRHLSDLQVDIALLQEVDARHQFVSPELNPVALCQYPQQALVAAPAINEDGGWYGNALLSRFPVIESRSVDVSQIGVEPRNIQVAKVDINGIHLHVINTHKGLKVAERQFQFAKLCEQLEILSQQPEAILLGGDFNEWQFFSSAFQGIKQVLQPIKTGATFPSRWPLFRLDRLWIKATDSLDKTFPMPKARVVKNAHTRLHSDHCPVIADIHID